MFRFASVPWQHTMLRWHRRVDVRRGWMTRDEAQGLEALLQSGTSPVEVWKQQRRLVRPRFWRVMLIRVVFGVLVIGGMLLLGEWSR